MERPKVEDYDLKPFGYIHALTLYAEYIEKQNKELVECLERIKDAINDKGCCGNSELIGMLVWNELAKHKNQ